MMLRSGGGQHLGGTLVKFHKAYNIDVQCYVYFNNSMLTL